MKLPEIVCLCGSTKFLDKFDEYMLKFSLEGKIVLTLGTHKPIARQYADGLEGKKPILDELHKRKIELADSIFVLNVGGYIGESTASEIQHAKLYGKKVTYLEEDNESK